MLKCGLDEANDSDSENGEEGTGPTGQNQKTNRVEYLALIPFKDIYKASPLC